MKCPICQLRCVVKINMDACECPDHGVMTGIDIVRVLGMEPWEAKLEIQCSQLLRQVNRLVQAEIWAIMNGKTAREYFHA